MVETITSFGRVFGRLIWVTTENCRNGHSRGRQMHLERSGSSGVIDQAAEIGGRIIRGGGG